MSAIDKCMKEVSRIVKDDPQAAWIVLDALCARENLTNLDRARAEMRYGTICRVQGKLSDARAYYAAARAILEHVMLESDHNLARRAAMEDADIERRLAILSTSEGKRNKALEHILHAMRTFTAVASKKWIARCWAVRGGIHLHFEEFGAALEWYRRALPYLHADELEGPPLAQNLYYALCRAELESGEPGTLLNELTEARLARESRCPSRAKHRRNKFTSTKMTLTDGRIRLSQAYLSILSNQYEDGLAYLKEARKVFGHHGARVEEAAVLLHMAECEIFFDKWKNIRSLAKQALKLLDKEEMPLTKKAVQLLHEAAQKERSRESRRQIKEARPLITARK